jgi:hypothetical protein
MFVAESFHPLTSKERILQRRDVESTCLPITDVETFSEKSHYGKFLQRKWPLIWVLRELRRFGLESCMKGILEGEVNMIRGTGGLKGGTVEKRMPYIT